jgi:hypothetical protein
VKIRSVIILLSIVEITQDLIDLGRDTFYRETFGNEVLFTDIVGVLDGPLNVSKITKAVLALKGTYTSNLQIPLEEDITVGDRTFKAGTILNTGLDVSRGSLFPLGLVTHVKQGQLKVGVSCALCHAAVNEKTGRIMEGATNIDINASQLLALASNTAALFRQTDVNPAKIFTGENIYLNSDGEKAYLPEPQKMIDKESLQRGAKVFQQANCAKCHSGRYFTNHQIIPVREIGTQPARAPASAGFAKLFVPPDTYPPNVSVPLPAEPPVLSVPTDITAQEDIELAYAQSDRHGGYKVIKLIGLYLHAPYLHDGGVAASDAALKQDRDGYYNIDRANEIGMVGTLMQGIKPDPGASLRMLVDRNLRESMVAANQANPDLQQANVNGSGHPYWVDKQAGFTGSEQTDLINFLLSLDDDPEVLPDDNS